MPHLTEEQSNIMLAALFLFITMCQRVITTCDGDQAKAAKWEHQIEVATATHVLLLDFLLG